MKLSSLVSKLRLLARKSGGGCRGVSLFSHTHYTAEIAEQSNGQIVIETGASISRSCWLNIPIKTETLGILHICAGAFVGRSSMISAKNKILIERECLISPHVLLMDHAHRFDDPDVPIYRQAETSGGTLVIETGCWIGFGAAVLANRGEVRIGRNSVIGANSVVTRSVPPLTVVAGNPARIVRRFDASLNAWVASNEPLERDVLNPQHDFRTLSNHESASG